MNLFRSKEHVRNWNGFKKKIEAGIIQLPDVVKVFSGSLFKRRLAPDYITHFQEHMGEMSTAMSEIGKTKPFWSPQAP
jgi:hypothetical protein